jgi:hypothetical protein
MTTIDETIEVHARKLPGLLSTVFGWPGNALARLKRDKARVWLVPAARSGADRRAPVVLHR